MSDLHVVSAGSRRDSPGLADTGGQNARTTSKTTDRSVGILPERTKTSCNTGGQNAHNTSKATDGSVGILPERIKN